MTTRTKSSSSRSTVSVEAGLLARLGLPKNASTQDVETAHDALIAYLETAPTDLRSWARLEMDRVDEAYALLSDPTIDRSALVASPEAQALPVAPAVPAATVAPAPDATVARPTGKGRTVRRLGFAGAAIAGAIVLVIAVFNMGGGTGVPPVNGSPDPAAAASPAIDTARCRPTDDEDPGRPEGRHVAAGTRRHLLQRERLRHRRRLPREDHHGRRQERDRPPGARRRPLQPRQARRGRDAVAPGPRHGREQPRGPLRPRLHVPQPEPRRHRERPGRVDQGHRDRSGLGRREVDPAAPRQPGRRRLPGRVRRRRQPERHRRTGRVPQPGRISGPDLGGHRQPSAGRPARPPHRRPTEMEAGLALDRRVPRRDRVLRVPLLPAARPGLRRVHGRHRDPGRLRGRPAASRLLPGARLRGRLLGGLHRPLGVGRAHRLRPARLRRDPPPARRRAPRLHGPPRGRRHRRLGSLPRGPSPGRRASAGPRVASARRPPPPRATGGRLFSASSSPPAGRRASGRSSAGSSASPRSATASPRARSSSSPTRPAWPSRSSSSRSVPPP